VLNIDQNTTIDIAAVKEDIIIELRHDILEWEEFRLPLPGTTDVIGLAIESAFPSDFPDGGDPRVYQSLP
jgi:hypothetical protein